MVSSELQQVRHRIAEFVASYIKPNDLVGLGTGHTASCFVHALARRQVPRIRCVVTSRETKQLAESLQLPLLSMEEIFQDFSTKQKPITVTVDGADEIDGQGQLIKGHGGALLWEKIVAHASEKVWILADETKCVSQLGQRRTVPVEIVPFGCFATLARIRQRFSSASLRANSKNFDRSPPRGGPWFVTDGGNYLVEVPLTPEEKDPTALHHWLKQQVGVVETGLFLTEATTIWLGKNDGSVTPCFSRMSDELR